ncbi:putative holin-like toxin [Veillonella dispar]|nr:putative holin-like toxin [Veillonella dispar]
MLVHLLRTLKGDGDMTVFEAISLMIAFATLVILIVK